MTLTITAEAKYFQAAKHAGTFFFMLTHLGKSGDHLDTLGLIQETSVNIGVNSE